MNIDFHRSERNFGFRSLMIIIGYSQSAILRCLIRIFAQSFAEKIDRSGIRNILFENLSVTISIVSEEIIVLSSSVLV